MKFYFMTKATGKCGCATSAWKVTEDFQTKTALKKRMGIMHNIKEVWTEEQLIDRYKEASQEIIAKAVKW